MMSPQQTNPHNGLGLKLALLDELGLHLAKDKVIYPLLQSKPESELYAMLQHLGCLGTADKLLYFVYAHSKSDDLLLANACKKFFWGFFYALGSEREGFTKQYAAIGPSADTCDILSEVLIVIIDSAGSISFRSIAEMNSLIAMRMHWRALDVIRKRKKHDLAVEELSRQHSSIGVLDHVVSQEEQSELESALTALCGSDQQFLADYLRHGSSVNVAKKYGLSSSAVRQRKSRLVGRLEELVAVG